MRFAFYGRVSTEDQQDPEASRGWQIRRAQGLIEPHGGAIVEQYFDVGQSRSLPWKRRPAASRLLADVASVNRDFEAIVIGEPQRAFYGNQFGLTFPVLTHYGVGLWVPEVGGAVDPGSEAHDMVMTLFGGMSKGERTRIQLRVKASMFDMAQRSDRFLGGRPPYGYQLADIGPHPNPGKAAAGQRAHKLVPDPVTAPVVPAIFDMFVSEGASLRLIAQRLAAAGIASPSAHDRARNQHRDPVGWAFGAVRAILSNPTYTGYRVWGKQQKVEALIDPDDVATGNRHVHALAGQGRLDPIRSANPRIARHRGPVQCSPAEVRSNGPAEVSTRQEHVCLRQVQSARPHLLRHLRFAHAGGVPGIQAQGRHRTDLLPLRDPARTRPSGRIRSPTVGLRSPRADRRAAQRLDRHAGGSGHACRGPG